MKLDGSHKQWCYMLHKKILVIFIFIFVFIIVSMSVLKDSAFAAPDPTEQFRPFIKKVTDLLADPKLKSLPKNEQGRRIVNVAREHFDFAEMSKRVLGQQWRKLNDSQQKEFEDLFTSLLQYTFINKIEKYSKQKVEFTQQRIKGDRAEVQTLSSDGERSINVSYIMLLHGDQWMAYDVIVDGVSLIRNYLEQFNEIIKKDGYDGLVKQVKDKIHQIETDQKHK